MNRYSFTTKKRALELLDALELEKGQTVSKDIHGIMVWGFEYKHTPILDENGMPTFDADGLPLFDSVKGKTYNVDVVWKGEQPNEWSEFEVFPETPSHTVS
jgi:hypothetical protein